MFNKGELTACAAIYGIGCEALRILKGIPEDNLKGLANPLAKARTGKSSRQQAWILRAGFDMAWNNLKDIK